MDVRVLAHGTRGGNQVALLELTEPAMLPIYVVTLQVFARAEKRQTWARTDFDPDVARELYNVACAEFIAPGDSGPWGNDPPDVAC